MTATPSDPERVPVGKLEGAAGKLDSATRKQDEPLLHLRENAGWGPRALELRGGSRLHFGLFATSPGMPPHTARVYGGMGLMVEEPGQTLRAFLSRHWQGEDRIGPRLREFRDRIRGQLPEITPIHLEEITWIPGHFGLGSGTQLGLAVAKLMGALLGKEWGLEELCSLSGRGVRSAIGSHGFAQGGFLVDAGHEAARIDSLGQIAARHDFPEQWSIVLCQWSDRPGMSGPGEKAVFETLAHSDAAEIRRDRLCRLALLGVLPALVHGAWKEFGEAIGEFNTVAGEPFALWQGGDQVPQSLAWLNFCRQNGVHGVGQSSWGPTLFAIAHDTDQARFLVDSWSRKGFGPPERIRIARARNEGATVSAIPDSVDQV